METVYDAILTSAINLLQVRRVGWNAAVQKVIGRLSGDVDPVQFSAIAAEPKIVLESYDIAGALTDISLATGLALSLDPMDGDGWAVPFNKYANGGTFAGAAANAMLFGTNGLWTIGEISAEQDALATVTVNGDFISDGIDPPVESSVNNTLAGMDFDALYTLGPVLLDGSTDVSLVKSIKISAGLKTKNRRFDGVPFCQLVSIVERNPMISITFVDADMLYTFGPMFASSASGAAYLRLLLDGGTVDDPANQTHIKLTFGGGLITADDFNATENDDGTGTLSFYATSLSASTTSTIP